MLMLMAAMIIVITMITAVIAAKIHLFIVGVLGTRSLGELSGRDDLRLVFPAN